MSDALAPRLASACLGDDDAARYVDGALDASERARANQHLATCTACRWLVSALAQRSPRAVADTVPAGVASALTTAALHAPTAAGDSELAAGARIGRYQVLRRVGAGGMGTVYAARDPELDREVAIKVVQPRGTGRREKQARLLREARAMARLSHPGVVPI